MIQTFFRGLLIRTLAVLRVHAGVALDAPTFPCAVDTAARELTVAARPS